MPTTRSIRSSPAKRPPNVLSDRGSAIESPGPRVFEVLAENRTLWQRTLDQFNGNEGAGYAISFVVHIVLLMILAVPVFTLIEPEQGFTTIVHNAGEEQVVFDAPLDTIVSSPEASSAEESFKTKIFNPLSPERDLIPILDVADTTSIKGDGDGTGSGGKLGGGRVAEPENAVKAGNFSVWNWPILPGRINGEMRFGTPGESPKVRQSYFIVIRVKVPKDRKFAKLTDFSGSVIGTDGYRQKIPDDAYFFRGNGELMKARSNTRMPVINGTAEILIEVPGAGFADIKDTIRVYSRILDEEQEIELVFKARS